MLRKFAIGIAALVAAVFLVRGLSAQHGGRMMMIAAPAMIEVPAGGISLPMQDVGGRPIVDVKINGKGPYRFIFDTGASMTVIDSELNDELKLPAVPGMHAAPGHGPTPTIVSVEALGVGGATLKGVTAALIPLGNLLTMDPRPRGVLSALSFPGHLVTFDYPGRKIGLRKGKLEPADSAKTFAYGADDPLPTVPIRVAGHETRVHLDTGSGYGLMLPTRFLEELPLGSKPEPAGKARVHGGEYPITKARVDGPIVLGAYKLDLPEVSFTDVKPGFGPARGNIGYEVLRNFVVTLDSRNRLVRLVW